MPTLSTLPVEANLAAVAGLELVYRISVTTNPPASWTNPTVTIPGAAEELQPTVDVAGDIITVTFSAEQSAALAVGDGVTPWEFTLDLDTTRAAIAGLITWAPPGTPATAPAEVTLTYSGDLGDLVLELEVTTSGVAGDGITRITAITAADYADLVDPDPTTLYVIVG